ncbi:hypothetical protein HMPREF1981_00578 [Bacteroides pyogenes F0041]|uniref:Uncharacterized protein n=1 Tax=Bacteroides pyogenes F0041 TaxID=1321819 RepID=U2E2L6_9BACE|nr:hypothetical protein HMPREF1981_00578 [Bacteroides pyogenes F0041]
MHLRKSTQFFKKKAAGFEKKTRRALKKRRRALKLNTADFEIKGGRAFEKAYHAE